MASSARAIRLLLRRVAATPSSYAASRCLRAVAGGAGGRSGIGAGGRFSGNCGSRQACAGGQSRSLFIQTQGTPNPQSLMFYPGNPVMEIGSADFPNARAGSSSPLAKALFRIDGVTRVFFGSDFVTVTKAEEEAWEVLKPEIFACIMDFYTSGQPLFTDAQTQAAADTAIHETDDETVAMIKELLETRIRPAVQDDGGDIEYRGFDAATGTVTLKMQGACSGCPSSAVTLKSGIENMLMHYVPEVKGVKEAVDTDDEDDGGVADETT